MTVNLAQLVWGRLENMTYHKSLDNCCTDNIFFSFFLSSLKCLWCSRLHISDLRVVEHCLPLATSIPMHSIQSGAEESMRSMNNKIWTLKQAFFLFDLHFLHPMGNLTFPLFKVAQVIIWYDEFGVGFKNAVTFHLLSVYASAGSQTFKYICCKH